MDGNSGVLFMMLPPPCTATFEQICDTGTSFPFYVLRYVPPDQARVVASVHASMSGSSASSTNSTPEVRPLKTLLGESAPPLHLSRNTPSQVGTHTFGTWTAPVHGFYTDPNALLGENSQSILLNFMTDVNIKKMFTNNYTVYNTGFNF